VVIHPPIDISRFNADRPFDNRTTFITVGRQAPQKHTELIVEACSKLGLPLEVIGRGPDHAHLASIAGSTVSFYRNLTDEEVAQHMNKARAFLFAAFDDFGITPVEAQAAGVPVIAYRAGGALDYVAEGKTGMFFEEQTAESLCGALKQFQTKSFDPQVIRVHAEQFSPEHFQRNMRTFLETLQK